MATLLDEIPEEVLAKYKPILAKSIEQTKEELGNLVNNYIEAVIEEDNELVISIVNELNSYSGLVPDFDNFLSYCLLDSINKLLVKLYGADLELYVPKPVDLSFSTFKEREAKVYIEENGLSEEEVELIVKHNVENLEIYSLTFFGYNLNTLEPKTVLPSNLTEHYILLNSNYMGKYERETKAKLFYAMKNMFQGDNEE